MPGEYVEVSIIYEVQAIEKKLFARYALNDRIDNSNK